MQVKKTKLKLFNCLAVGALGGTLTLLSALSAAAIPPNQSDTTGTTVDSIPPNQSDNTGTSVLDIPPTINPNLPNNPNNPNTPNTPNNPNPTTTPGTTTQSENDRIELIAIELSKRLQDAYTACVASRTSASNAPRRFARGPVNANTVCTSAACVDLNQVTQQVRSFINSLDQAQRERLQRRNIRLW